METEALFFGMDKREIGFLRFLLEAYDGIAALTTLDGERGLVMVRIAPGCTPLVREIIASLDSETPLTPFTEGEVISMGFSTVLCPV